MIAARIELLALIVVAPAVFLIADHRFGKGCKPKAARWAKRGDLKPLRVSGPKRGRVILGRFEGSLIAAEDRASTVVMGPTQLAGKSSRVVIPAILEWDGPVLTTSIKRDTLDATLSRRQELGEVKVFDPLGRTGIPTATWSPVAAAASWTQAREVAGLRRGLLEADGPAGPVGQLGISEKTLHRAKNKLEIRVSKAGYQGAWSWSLKDASKDRQAGLATFEDQAGGHLWKHPVENGRPGSRTSKDGHPRDSGHLGRETDKSGTLRAYNDGEETES